MDPGSLKRVPRNMKYKLLSSVSSGSWGAKVAMPPPPRPAKIGHTKMATKISGLSLMFLDQGPWPASPPHTPPPPLWIGYLVVNCFYFRCINWPNSINRLDRNRIGEQKSNWWTEIELVDRNRIGGQKSNWVNGVPPIDVDLYS